MSKDDYNDAEAIAEAAQRPTMRFVPIKSVEQQDIQNLHCQRERIKKARTALVNQVRGLLAEYGIVINKGVAAVRKGQELRLLDDRFKHSDKQIEASNRGNEVCQRLDEILGVGPITASAVYAAAGDGKNFVNGRHFSAWIGLVPGQHSTGGKTTLLGISKRGNVYLRTLFIHGARAVLQHSANKTDRFSLWAQALLERRGYNKACVAVANKMARMAWVIMAKGETYRPAMS